MAGVIARGGDGADVILVDCLTLWINNLLYQAQQAGRELDEDEMAEYRRPFATPGEDRRPTLSWPRQIPVDGEPAVLHADAVVIAERPKLGPHFAAMKAALAPLLGLPPDGLGLKAKTNEGLGLIGRGRAIACWATVLVGPIS